MKFFRADFFHRYTDSTKERPLTSLKRRAQAAQRRRYTMQPDRLPPPQFITPPRPPPVTPDEPPEPPAPEPATTPTPAPATPQPSAEIESETPPPTPPPPAAADDDPDPFDSTLEPALELSASDLACADISSKAPASVHEIEVSSSPQEASKEDEEEEKVPPGAGPKCSICHEFTGIPRCGEEEDDGRVEKVASLPCGHRFGHLCLLAWLDQDLGQTCPLCRYLHVHEECGHSVIPALADDAPPSYKGRGGRWEVPKKCMSCRVEGEPGTQMLKYQWQMEEARGMALVSMTQVPNEWAESRIQREWVRLSEETRRVEGTWREELERSWLGSQKGRCEW